MALLCVGLVLVIVSADESIKRLLNLARYMRLSQFVVSFVLAGVIAILPELSRALVIGVVTFSHGSVVSHKKIIQKRDTTLFSNVQYSRHYIR